MPEPLILALILICQGALVIMSALIMDRLDRMHRRRPLCGRTVMAPDITCAAPAGHPGPCLVRPGAVMRAGYLRPPF